MAVVLSVRILAWHELWWRQSNLRRTLSHLLLRTLALYESVPVACLPVDTWAVITRWKLNLTASGLRSPPVPVPVRTASLLQSLTSGPARTQAEQCPCCTHTQTADNPPQTALTCT